MKNEALLQRLMQPPHHVIIGVWYVRIDDAKQVHVQFYMDRVQRRPSTEYHAWMEEDAIIYSGGGLFTQSDPPSYLTLFLVEVFKMLAQGVQP